MSCGGGGGGVWCGRAPEGYIGSYGWKELTVAFANLATEDEDEVVVPSTMWYRTECVNGHNGAFDPYKWDITEINRGWEELFGEVLSLCLLRRPFVVLGELEVSQKKKKKKPPALF